MKVLISADMEGCPGIVSVEQTRPDGKGYTEACRFMTEHVNAAIEGAMAGGADEVIVADAHMWMRNILPVELDRRAELIQGTPRQLSMVQGVDEECALALFVGYHARAGSYGGISHTWAGRLVHEVRINGQSASEALINAYVCGHYGVPVGLVTGDEACVAQVIHDISGALTVATKASYSRSAARMIAPDDINFMLRQRAQEAVVAYADGSGPSPMRLSGHLSIEVELIDPGMADLAEFVPGTTRVSATTLRFDTENILEAFKAMQAMLLAAANYFQTPR